MNEYLTVLRRFRDFSGRSRRREYWIFVLVNWVISFVLGFVDRQLGLDFGVEGLQIGILGGIFYLIFFVPSLAVDIRRLHDIGRSGWWYLIIFIPLAGAIWLLVLNVTDSEPVTNQWGPNPKGAAPVQSGAWG
ncbi:DUF805 domain-containing protein [Deinococcus puniceus]|uniref:DUF805 domain-containing protein n=1 Tax=Deinococcus puniceus TaxID=1182568 RepID=A0A172TAN2_9DEIO|nr:DUF805 domain-containing protein [Deinococcus puniceus]ANE44004.1 hypothetical protein SU48_09695 [Deinococcus puniceus]